MSGTRDKVFMLIFIVFAGFFCSCADMANSFDADLVDASSITDTEAIFALAGPEITDINIITAVNGEIYYPIYQQIISEHTGILSSNFPDVGTIIREGDILAVIGANQDELALNMQILEITIEQDKRNFMENENTYQASLAESMNRLGQLNGAAYEIAILEIEKAAANRQKAIDDYNTRQGLYAEEYEHYIFMSGAIRIAAPFDGYISYSAGKNAGDAIRAGELLFEIRDISIYQFAFSGDYPTFGYNMPVTVLFSEIPPIEGRIVSIPSPGRTASPSVFYVDIYEEIPEEDRLRLQTVIIRITYQSASNTLTIPTMAVKSENRRSYVYIYDQGAIKKRYVSIGLSNSDITQVLEGLDINDQIILNHP